MDLRCPHRKFGELIQPSADPGRVEISCPSRFCGRTAGVVVLHTFCTATGELLSTERFREPTRKG